MDVLFVDDESAYRKQAKALLEKEDERLNIKTTSSAKNALNLLENNNYEAIVSDYKMPETNGIELLETLRENNNDKPFIILTGKGREEVAMKALNLGADRYFRKSGEPKSQFNLLAKAILSEVKHYRAKRKVKESEKKFRRIFEASPDPVFLLDSEGIIENVNQTALKKLKFERNEIVGSPLQNAPFLPEKAVEKVMKKFNKRKKGKYAPPYVVELLKNNGESLLVEVNVKPLRSKHEFGGEIVVARDITERTELEADRLMNKMAEATSENIVETIIWEIRTEFEVEINLTSAELGLPDFLKHLAKFGTDPSPENVYELMIIGTQKTLIEKEIEIDEKKIKKILTPIIKNFLKQIFNIAEEYYIQIPTEYKEFEKKFKKL